MPKLIKKNTVEFPYSMLNGQVVLHHGCSKAVLQSLPAKSVHCVVTSPPYWGLRDYKVDGQIGVEESPEQYIEDLVRVFREVRRVLRDDGTVWLNLGDTYDGEVLGIPWRVALALREDGWILRQDIIWHKPSPMPESVTNRCTKSHEYIFLLTKRQEYYFDQFSIREEPLGIGGEKLKSGTGRKRYSADQLGACPSGSVNTHPAGRNKRSVWTIASAGFDGAHFACFPPKLIEPCILAGCPERVCSKCGAPQTRAVDKEQLLRDRPNDYVKRKGAEGTGNSCSNSVAGVASRTVGWAQGCYCNVAIISGTVLDPFVGSGTTCCVAIENGRNAIGIDLSSEYLSKIAIPRIEGTAYKTPMLAQQIVAAKPPRALTGGKRFT